MTESIRRDKELARLRLRGLPVPPGLCAPTTRQAEVVQLAMRGKRWKEIAAELWLSQKTVEDHMRNIKRAAAEGGEPTSGPIDLVIYALKYDLVPPDCPLGEALAAWAARKR